MKLYIGNLSWDTDTEKLKTHFEPFGAVSDAVVITDLSQWTTTLKQRKQWKNVMGQTLMIVQSSAAKLHHARKVNLLNIF